MSEERRDPRSFVAALLVQYGYSHEAAETLVQRALDKHAHELAEKIRSELPETVKESLGGGIWTITTVPTAKQAADLIDPESDRE